jgi:hypothetical protein
VADGEAGERQQLVFCVPEHGLDLRELPAEHAGDDVELGVHVGGVGLGEDGADRGGDHLGVALRHAGEHVAHERGLSGIKLSFPGCGVDDLLCASTTRSAVSSRPGSRCCCRI